MQCALDSKGTVENAIQHTQSTALKGRKFESIEAQNEWLAHWEARWAAPRIHGRKKRQVLAMFEEERPYLRPLPTEHFRFFRQVTRTVDDAGCVQVDTSYYAASPAPLYSEVAVRVFEREVEILGDDGEVLRRHDKSTTRGEYVLPEADRIFNPSRQTAQLIGRVSKIGPSQRTTRARDLRSPGSARREGHLWHGQSAAPLQTRRHRARMRASASLEPTFLPSAQTHP